MSTLFLLYFGAIQNVHFSSSKFFHKQCVYVLEHYYIYAPLLGRTDQAGYITIGIVAAGCPVTEGSALEDLSGAVIG